MPKLSSKPTHKAPPKPKLAASKSARARARKIKLILFDVDGVLTDGRLFFFPTAARDAAEGASISKRVGDPTADAKAASPSLASTANHYTSTSSIEFKGFHAHDGVAFSLARVAGIQTGVVTKWVSETVTVRARDLRLDYVYQGIGDKLGAVHDICAKAGITVDEVAFVGDDVIDLPAMRGCGLAIAVANARDEVKREAHWITKVRGGEGAARDAVEYILKAQGVLERVVDEYVSGGSPAKRKKK